MTQSGQQEVREFGGEASGKKGFLSLKKEAWERRCPFFLRTLHLVKAALAPCNLPGSVEGRGQRGRN